LNARTVRASAGVLRPVQPGFGLVQLVRVGHALFRLRPRDRLDAGAQQAQAVGQHLRAQLGQLVVQLAAGIGGGDRQLLVQQHRAGVQAGLHLHQAHAGFGVAGLDRTLDRRRAAPARQQRGMHVPATLGRDGQHGLRQDQAVGHHHHQVRLQVAQLPAALRACAAIRL
jgi:hypothetical protein